MLGPIKVPDFMPFGGDCRGGEGVVGLPDCSLGPLISQLRVVTTSELENSTVNVGSLLVNFGSEDLSDLHSWQSRCRQMVR